MCHRKCYQSLSALIRLVDSTNPRHRTGRAAPNLLSACGWDERGAVQPAAGASSEGLRSPCPPSRQPWTSLNSETFWKLKPFPSGLRQVQFPEGLEKWATKARRQLVTLGHFGSRDWHEAVPRLTPVHGALAPQSWSTSTLQSCCPPPALGVEGQISQPSEKNLPARGGEGWRQLPTAGCERCFPEHAPGRGSPHLVASVPAKPATRPAQDRR